MHFYLKGKLVPPWTDGALPSVTTILDVRRKPGLEAWRRRVGDEAADLRMTESQNRGELIHTYVEQIASYDTYSFYSGDADIDHCVNAFIAWRMKYNPIFTRREFFVEHTNYGYAGCLDLMCTIDDAPWIIDIKTGGQHWEHALQLAAYRHAYEYRFGIKAKTACLYLTNKTKKGWIWKPYNAPVKQFLYFKGVFDTALKYEPIRQPKEELTWSLGS